MAGGSSPKNSNRSPHTGKANGGRIIGASRKTLFRNTFRFAWSRLAFPPDVLKSGSFPNGGRKTRLETTPAPPLRYVTEAWARDVAARSAEAALERGWNLSCQAGAYSNRAAVQFGYIIVEEIIVEEIPESAEVLNMANKKAK